MNPDWAKMWFWLDWVTVSIPSPPTKGEVRVKTKKNIVVDLHSGYLSHSKEKNYAETMDSKKVIMIPMRMDKTERKEKGVKELMPARRKSLKGY